jgi:hypothetical protein
MKSRLLATGLLAGLALGLPACESRSPAAPPPAAATPVPTPVPVSTLGDLSASVTSPQAGRQLNCRSAPRARVSLANRGPGSVVVQGVRHTSRILGGGCTPASEFTFRPKVPAVAGGTTARVLDQPIYLGGSGCCVQGSRCDGSSTCRVEDSFEVVTGLGDVDAGSFEYRVNFSGCVRCPDLRASSRAGACLPARSDTDPGPP